MKPEKRSKLTEFNRQNILTAAKQLFLENGTTKTTVDHIATAADCSKATIYVYFQNKDDIYYHIVHEYMTILLNEIQKQIKLNQDFKSTYLSLCRSLTEFEKRYPIYFQCLLGRISIDHKDRESLPVLELIYQVGEQINDVIKDFLNHARTESEVNLEEITTARVMVLWSSICSLISLYSNKGEYINSLSIGREEFLMDGFEMILRMLYRKHGG